MTRAYLPPAMTPSGLADWTLDTALRTHVEAVLHYTEGDLGWAADEMGVNRSTLYRWQRAWRDGRTARVPEKGGRARGRSSS